MTLRLPEDILLDIADIFDEFTPQNKIDRAFNLIRKRYAGNHNFWPGIADQIRQHVEFEKKEELLDAARVEQMRAELVELSARTVEMFCEPKPEAPPILLGEPTKVFTEEREDPIRDDVGDHLKSIQKVIDEKPEFTLKRTRQKRTNPNEQ